MGMDTLSPLMQALVALLLLLGAVFLLVGALGMLRFRDVFMRLHAPTKATTLGVGGVLLASLLARWAQGHWAVHELLITLFLFVTAPVSANLLAKAALHLRSPSVAPLPPDAVPGLGSPGNTPAAGPGRPEGSAPATASAEAEAVAVTGAGRPAQSAGGGAGPRAGRHNNSTST